MPYGTGRLLVASEAINCLATIVLSLRDEIKTPHYLRDVNSCALSYALRRLFLR